MNWTNTDQQLPELGNWILGFTDRGEPPYTIARIVEIRDVQTLESSAWGDTQKKYREIDWHDKDGKKLAQIPVKWAYLDRESKVQE